MPPSLETFLLNGPLALLLAPFVGSFAGTLAQRLPRGEAVVLGRSRCAACGHPLGWRDLVPLASYLASHGRCRHCGAPVGWFYPAVELAALAVAASAALTLQGPALWLGCLLGWTLVALAAADLVALVLPDALTLPLLGAGLVAAWWLSPWALPERLVGAAAGYLVFRLLAAAYRRLRRREGLGLGDAKLLAAAGAWVGWPGLPGVVLLGALLALAAAAIAHLFGRPLAADQPVAFGAALAAATWAVWLYGPLVIGG